MPLSQLVSFQVVVKFWEYMMADVTCAGLLSFAVLYCISPSGDERILNLIQWHIPASRCGVYLFAGWCMRGLYHHRLDPL